MNKPYHESMTLQGLALILLTLGAQKLGLTVDAATLAGMIDEVLQAVGSVMIAIGRIRATHKLGKPDPSKL